jgi:O-antigen ligase
VPVTSAITNHRVTPRAADPSVVQTLPGFVQCYAVAVLVLGTGAFFPLLSADPDAGSDLRVFGLWVLAYAVAVGLVLDAALRERRRVGVPPELVLFLLLAATSVFWSVAPGLTLRRSVGLLGTVIVGVALAQRLGVPALFDALRRAMVIIAVSSLLLYASGSSYALDSIHGTLRGVAITKNSLGFFMALGLLACAAGALIDRSRARSAVVSAVPMMVALALTDSKTGLVIAAVVALYATTAVLGRRRSGPLALASLALFACAGAAVLAPTLTLASSAALIGEDTTLTGRDEIWQESLLAADARQYLGHGYGSFWDASDTAERIRARVLWEVPHAHNGPLDILLDLGVVGVVLAGAVVLGLIVRGVSDLVQGHRRQAALRLPLALLLISTNLVESNLLQQNSLITVLLVTALALPRPPAALR